MFFTTDELVNVLYSQCIFFCLLIKMMVGKEIFISVLFPAAEGIYVKLINAMLTMPCNVKLIYKIIIIIWIAQNKSEVTFSLPSRERRGIRLLHALTKSVVFDQPALTRTFAWWVLLPGNPQDLFCPLYRYRIFFPPSVSQKSVCQGRLSGRWTL